MPRLARRPAAQLVADEGVRGEPPLGRAAQGDLVRGRGRVRGRVRVSVRVRVRVRVRVKVRGRRHAPTLDDATQRA